jgi:hypothetical protein
MRRFIVLAALLLAGLVGARAARPATDRAFSAAPAHLASVQPFPVCNGTPMPC